MVFTWIDCDGQSHQLEAPQPILDEAEALAREIDGLLLLITSPDRSSRDLARKIIGAKQHRLEALASDIDRWNLAVEASNRALAQEYVVQIAQLAVTLRVVLLIVALHDEHDWLAARTAGDLAAWDLALAAPMTATQRAAIDAAKERVSLGANATRGEAREWLQQRPLFAREHVDTSGWFAWRDREQHGHQLADPLPIEREATAVAGELRTLADTLARAETGSADLFKALEKAAVLLNRLPILKGDLERFQAEADARDLATCKQFAADWRSKRTK